MPERVDVHQDRMLAGSDYIFPVAINRLQKISHCDHAAETLVKSPDRRFVFARSRFDIFHPGIGTAFQNLRRSQFRSEAVAIHPFQELEPRRLAAGRARFVNQPASLEFEQGNCPAAIVRIR
jgi:hypothetical protein